MQQSVRGGVVAAPVSSGLASRGRLTTQMWSSLSVTMTGIPWRIHLCGNGLGQKGSTLYIGTGTSSAGCVCAFAFSKKPAQQAKRPTATADAAATLFQIFIEDPLRHSKPSESPVARSVFSPVKDVNFGFRGAIAVPLSANSRAKLSTSPQA